MRILLVNYEYPPVGGGAANATREMARAFVALGHTPFVLTAKFRDRQRDAANPEIELIEVPARRRRIDRCSIVEMTSFAISASWRIRRVLRRERIDAMIAFFSIPCGPIAWWGWRATKVPYVVSLRGGDVPGNEPGISFFHSILQPLRRAVFRRAKAIVANSAGLKAASQSADPFAVSLIPNGVDAARWRPAERSVAPRAQFRLIFVGRFQTQKNLTWLLSHLAPFNHSEIGLGWTLDLVGDGPLRQDLMAQAERLGIAKRLQWHGWVEQKKLLTLYQESDLLVSAARYEGMPNVVLEAQACGLPALLSEVAGHRDMIRVGENGWLFSLERDVDFSETLTKAMGSGERLKAMRQRARLDAVQLHSWQAVAEKYLQLLGNSSG